MRAVDLDNLYSRFSDQRFTVNDYVGAHWHNYRADECVKFFDDGVADGDLQIVPGPRGGRGYRLTPKAIGRVKRNRMVTTKRDARNKARWDAEAARETATRIEQAVRLLEQHGYHVIPPAAW